MPLLNWDSNYSVNVNHLDDQHIKLLNMINELYNALINGESKEVLDQVLNSMHRYMITHFNEEEYFMIKFNYKDYEHHKKQHEQFITRVKGFMNQYEAGNETITYEVLRFLVDWLRNHIIYVDKQYITCFNANGLK